MKMELIELLIKLNESLKDIDDHDNIHIELKKHDGKFTIKRFYTQDVNSKGGLRVDDYTYTIKLDGEKLVDMVMEKLKKEEHVRQRFSNAE